jgi:RNA polymerase sigma-70 factor (ECF subfamily)
LFVQDPDRAFDQYLVSLAQGGSREAFERLARRWSPRLLRFAARTIGRSDHVRDIVQETWIAVIRGIRRLRDPASFPAWIYGIAHRRCVDYLRGNQRRQRLASGMAREPEATADAHAGGIESTFQANRDLATAMGRLGDEQRVVIQLFYGEELGIGEIASVLSIPPGTVKSRLFHARQTLRKITGE